jgi:DNA-directed RNA polymerase specialized sigma subunit
MWLRAQTNFKKRKGQNMNFLYETQERLTNYEDCKHANLNLKNRLSQLNQELEGYKPIIMSDMPSGGGSVEPDDRICNLIYERDRTKEMLEKNTNQLKNFDIAFNQLPEEDRKILTMAFIKQVDESTIVKNLNVSRNTYFRERKKVLKRFARKLHGIVVDGY